MEPSKRPRLVTRKHPDDDPGADFVAHLGEQVSHLRDAVEDLAREQRAVHTEPVEEPSWLTKAVVVALIGMAVTAIYAGFAVPWMMRDYHDRNTPAPTTSQKDLEHDRRLDNLRDALNEFRRDTEARFRENEAKINRSDP